MGNIYVEISIFTEVKWVRAILSTKRIVKGDTTFQFTITKLTTYIFHLKEYSRNYYVQYFTLFKIWNRIIIKPLWLIHWKVSRQSSKSCNIDTNFLQRHSQLVSVFSKNNIRRLRCIVALKSLDGGVVIDQ